MTLNLIECTKSSNKKSGENKLAIHTCIRRRKKISNLNFYLFLYKIKQRGKNANIIQTFIKQLTIVYWCLVFIIIIIMTLSNNTKYVVLILINRFH